MLIDIKNLSSILTACLISSLNRRKCCLTLLKTHYKICCKAIKKKNYIIKKILGSQGYSFDHHDVRCLGVPSSDNR